MTVDEYIERLTLALNVLADNTPSTAESLAIRRDVLPLVKKVAEGGKGNGVG